MTPLGVALFRPFGPGGALGRALAFGALGAFLLPGGGARAEPALVLNSSTVHLRSGTQPEWDEFAGKPPDGAQWKRTFEGRQNSADATLFIQQDNVKLDWTVDLNGQKLGTLFLMEAPLVHTLNVPAGLLRDGTNMLSILPPKDNDDILLGPVTLEYRQRDALLQDSALLVRITDAENHRLLPARLTVVDEYGNLAALHVSPTAQLAARPGVVYTAAGEAKLGLRPGQYTVYATRGFEYGLDQGHVSLATGQTFELHLELRREVDTRGMVACDTHIHTGTYARHGDATVEERAVTLAGEGIELPISTEHNCLVDLTGAVERTGVQNWLAPVIGEEVTTARGHFNIFPVDLLAPLPDTSITDWPRLMKSLRATPGVQVVVLNHPRNIHNGFQPFASTNSNASTGQNLRGFEFSFDAVEVANSSALQSDWMVSFRDCFALVNYGYRVTAVGSSDVHDVSRYIVGQGRTYLACDDSDPAHVDINAACRSLKAGRAWVSLGLLADIKVDDHFGVGDLATGLGAQVRVEITVQAPSWVTADRVQLFANGLCIRDEKLNPAARPKGPLREHVTWVLERPKHDTFLIALASGPGVREPYWAISRPFQPSSTHWDPRVVGATNPVWIDADGDGKFTCAREYARQLKERYGDDPSGLRSALADYDDAVRAQVEGLTPVP